MADLLKEKDGKDKFNKKYKLKLSLKEIQLIHDILWSIAYKDIAEDSEYKRQVVDIIYTTEDLSKLCDDFTKITDGLGGYISEFEYF